MPTYDFRCPECEYVTSEIRSYEKRKEPATCPKCKTVMEYLFPGPSFYFVGGSPTAKQKHQVTSKEQFMEGVDDDF